jgi:hypothetical protein|uniref:Uncharacterized protein n=1 Tax=Desulfobacca acetoxidans TaxID=60893 RepID=A0A7V6A1B5_9BACT
MALIDLPQAKWNSGTGRQVILKGDFDKIEQAVVESFELTRSPGLEYLSASRVQVNATPDCKARVMLTGFPSPLHRGVLVDGGLSDGRYRENAAPAILDLALTGSLWGARKASQWYAVLAVAGAGDTTFTLKGMPLVRVSTQASQTITLRNNANTANIGYGFAANELVDSKILMLTGASRGAIRAVTGNNSDNGASGTLTYGGSALSLAQGDWFVVLPNTNFRFLGMILQDGSSNLVPFDQEGSASFYRSPLDLAQGAINGFTAFDLGLAAPPTARRLWGSAAATTGADVRLAISYDGSSPALLIHATPPASAFQGVRGAAAFGCLVPCSHKLYLDNGNIAGQVVRVTGWEE